MRVADKKLNPFFTFIKANVGFSYFRHELSLLIKVRTHSPETIFSLSSLLLLRTCADNLIHLQPCQVCYQAKLSENVDKLAQKEEDKLKCLYLVAGLRV